MCVIQGDQVIPVEGPKERAEPRSELPPQSAQNGPVSGRCFNVVVLIVSHELT